MAADLALLLLAVGVVAVPGLLGDRPPPDPVVERRAVEPLRIDVETAPWYEWALLHGIGEARARRIVGWVREHRPLRSLDELERVPGLPGGWLDDARPHLRLAPRDGEGAPEGGDAPPGGAREARRAEPSWTDPSSS